MMECNSYDVSVLDKNIFYNFISNKSNFLNSLSWCVIFMFV